MKAALLVSTALLAGLALGARAQTAPPATTTNPDHREAKAIRTQTADRRAATYKGPRVVKDSKSLGRKFLRDSKPAHTLRTPVQ